MKQLIIRNLKLRKTSLIYYAILLVIAPFFHLYVDKNDVWGGFFFAIFSMLIMFITLFDCGNAFRLQFKLGGNKAYYFNHSLPFSAKEQLNAHYLTTIIMSIAGTFVLIAYYNVPSNAQINGIELATPLFFIAVNFIGHALAFPKYSEVRKDYIPYWAFIIFMNFILPIILVVLLFVIAFLFYGFENVTDNMVDQYVNIIGVIFFVLSVALFGLTYFKQLKKINEAEQKY